MNIWNGACDIIWYTTNKDSKSYTIKSAEELAGLARLVNNTAGLGSTVSFQGKTIKLGSNILLNDIKDWQNWKKANYKNSHINKWSAIGKSIGISFQGTFDGNGKSISGIYINGKDDYQGLFGFVGKDGTIKNLIIENSYIKGKNYIGGLSGYTSGAKITQCKVGAIIEGDDCVGGLTGANSDSSGTYDKCKTAESVKGNSNVGGLTGSNSGIIKNCCAEGNVEGSMLAKYKNSMDEMRKKKNIGGLVGSNNSGIISGCYSIGKVSGGECVEVGGLVGNNSGKIVNCYARGYVSSKITNIGGLVGCNKKGSLIDMCYAAGKINGPIVKFDGENEGDATGVGGLVGDDEGTVRNSYYDKKISRQGYNGIGISKTTVDMKKQVTFEGWDFNTIWNINYPSLKNVP